VTIRPTMEDDSSVLFEIRQSKVNITTARLHRSETGGTGKETGFQNKSMAFVWRFDGKGENVSHACPCSPRGD
jgi:hypothetical protein